MNAKQYFIYILASKKDGVLYAGVTNNLERRSLQHKLRETEGFTKDYWVHRLVWYESTNSIESAIQREKQIKKWYRLWKIRMIEEVNPDWEDLFPRFPPARE